MSTMLATLAMTGVTFLITEAHQLTNRRAVVTDTKSSKEITPTVTGPVGLTRERPAFNKALDMLAAGAATNPELVTYHRAVSMRVASEVKPDASSSGESDLNHAESGSDNFAPTMQVSAQSAPPPPLPDSVSPTEKQSRDSQSGIWSLKRIPQ
jgi:hypothetical protein